MGSGGPSLDPWGAGRLTPVGHLSLPANRRVVVGELRPD